jgi:hypothetical protein
MLNGKIKTLTKTNLLKSAEILCIDDEFVLRNVLWNSYLQVIVQTILEDILNLGQVHLPYWGHLSEENKSFV